MEASKQYDNIKIYHSSRTVALGSTQPLTEMSNRNLPEGKGRPVRKTDKLTTIKYSLKFPRCLSFQEQNYSGALVRQRTIPTERPPLGDEVSTNFSG
jgi:hypothetical protein